MSSVVIDEYDRLFQSDFEDQVGHIVAKVVEKSVSEMFEGAHTGYFTAPPPPRGSIAPLEKFMPPVGNPLKSVCL